MRRTIFAVVAAACVALAGCAAASSEPSKHTYKQTEFHLKVIPDTDEFLTKQKIGEVIDGEAQIGNGHCVIRLRKYPTCLLHEIRHCIEGDFHQGQRINNEDCEG